MDGASEISGDAHQPRQISYFTLPFRSRIAIWPQLQLPQDFIDR